MEREITTYLESIRDLPRQEFTEKARNFVESLFPAEALDSNQICHLLSQCHYY